MKINHLPQSQPMTTSFLDFSQSFRERVETFMHEKVLSYRDERTDEIKPRISDEIVYGPRRISYRKRPRNLRLPNRVWV